MHHILPGEDSTWGGIGCKDPLIMTAEISVGRRNAVISGALKTLPIIGVHHAEGCATKAQRLFKHRLKNRGKFARG